MYRLWKNGAAGKEYFLLENRQRTLYDRKLPGDGLLVYHVDETIDGNENENHPFIKLLEADGLNASARRHEPRRCGRSRIPGSSKNVSLTNTSNPNAQSYGGVNTSVTVTEISASAASMTARIGVKGGVLPGGLSKSRRKGAARRRPAKRAASTSEAGRKPSRKPPKKSRRR